MIHALSREHDVLEDQLYNESDIRSNKAAVHLSESNENGSHRIPESLRLSSGLGSRMCLWWP